MWENLKQMTNATKAAIIVVVNSAFSVMVAFGVDLSDKQIGAVILFVNGLLGLWTLLTKEKSKLRAR